MSIYNNYQTLYSARDSVQACILNDLWLYTSVPKFEIDDDMLWLFILFELMLTSGIDTLLSEYQYLNPLF